MKIKKYNNYLLQLLIESVIVTSAEFKKIISDIPEDNRVADWLYKVLDDKKDIKTTVNYLDQTDKNDEVSFIPDNQYQRFLQKEEDPSTKTKNKAKIGRMMRQLLKGNDKNFSEVEIEKFVNQFKATWDLKHGIGRKVQIVKGDDIIYWYNENNYLRKEGTLGNSCMRYPSRSEYMRLYASNPNQVSMIIVLQDDKLVARSLLWKLDDGRVYLDRIYAITDSDFDFVYNWALKNVASGKVENMPSHLKGVVGTIKSTLQNVLQEKYPYADSMCYLYQEVTDGQIQNKGFASNDWNEKDIDSYEGYLVRIMQETSGDSSVRNYKYSDHLDKWISDTEAVWASDVVSYVPEDIAVKCKWDNNYYLKDSCIFNEILNDWIPERKAINTDKYGMVLPTMLADVVLSYLGSESDPLKIWFDIKTNKNVKIEKELKRGGSVSMFRPGYSPISAFYDQEFRVSDYSRESQVNFLCYKCYEVDAEYIEISEIKPLLFSYYGRFVTEIDAEIFNIPVIKENISYISAWNYLMSHSDINYKTILKLIDSSNANQNLKSQRIEIAETIHKNLLEESVEYKFNNSLSDVLGEKNQFDLSIDFFKEAIDSIDDYEVFSNAKTLDETIDIAAQRELSIELYNSSQEQVELAKKYTKLLMFIYTLHPDAYDATDSLAKYVKKFNEEDYKKMISTIKSSDYNYGENCFLLIRRILRAGIDYEIKNAYIKVLDEFSDKHNLSTSRFRNNFNDKNYLKFDSLDLSQDELSKIERLIS